MYFKKCERCVQKNFFKVFRNTFIYQKNSKNGFQEYKCVPKNFKKVFETLMFLKKIKLCVMDFFSCFPKHKYVLKPIEFDSFFLFKR